MYFKRKNKVINHTHSDAYTICQWINKKTLNVLHRYKLFFLYCNSHLMSTSKTLIYEIICVNITYFHIFIDEMLSYWYIPYISYYLCFQTYMLCKYKQCKKQKLSISNHCIPLCYIIAGWWILFSSRIVTGEIN